MSSVIRPAAQYIDDDLVISAKQAWTFVRVPTVSYEFLSYEDRQSLASKIFLSLSALVSSEKAIDVISYVTSRRIPVEFWKEDILDQVAPWNPAPGWNRYVEQMGEYLDGVGFSRKEVYLGVCLGNRNDRGVPRKGNNDVFRPLKAMFGMVEDQLDIDDPVVSSRELDYWRLKANEVRRSLAQSHINATPAHPNAIAYLIRKMYFPGSEPPVVTSSNSRVWGTGEIQALAEATIDNSSWRHLEIENFDEVTGESIKGYQATLAFSRFPDSLQFPDQEPWIHFAAALGFPTDVYSRFTLVPASKVHKDVSTKLAEARDQANHIAETGAGVPIQIQEQFDKATALEYLVAKERLPWMYGRHRIIVTGSTKEELYDRARKTIEHYRDLGIDVRWPTADQLSLFLEAMPGDTVRVKSYLQRQELTVLAGGMPNASSEVGDRIDDKGRGWIGPYLGYTTSRIVSMVNFSPHVAPARNRPPGVAITGEPGAGKSFCAFTIAYQMAMQGVWTIYIDPKADAEPMTRLHGLGKPRMIDLRHGHDGLLDPFSMADTVPEQSVLALETLRLLLGGEMHGERAAAVTLAIENVIARPNPSLYAVVEELLNMDSAEAVATGRMLRLIRDMPFARLCFAPQTSMRLTPEDGLTVIQLLGLDLPSAQTAPENYTVENRLAVSVMYLLTRFSRGLMLSMNKRHPKAICIDEAWAVTATPQGAKLVPEIARMGRSHNTALVLVSQNAGDLMEQAVTNSISTKLAFRSSIREEVDSVLTLLGMDLTDAHREVVRDLKNGECLMCDVDNRLSRVQVDGWNAELKTAFDTNPVTRGSSEAAEQKKSEKRSIREW